MHGDTEDVTKLTSLDALHDASVDSMAQRTREFIARLTQKYEEVGRAYLDEAQRLATLQRDVDQGNASPLHLARALRQTRHFLAPWR